MAKELHTNNAVSTLAAAAGATDTTLTIQAADAGLFASPGAGEYQPLTLLGAGVMEICRIVGRSGGVLTVERGTSGYAALSWPSGTRVASYITAESMNTRLQNVSEGDATTLAIGEGAGIAPGQYSAVAVGSGAGALANGTAVGANADAGVNSVSVGLFASSAGSAYSAAVGQGAIAEGGLATALGGSAHAYGSGTAVGQNTYAAADAIAIGREAYANSQYSLAIGEWTYAGAMNSIAIGNSAYAGAENSVTLGNGGNESYITGTFSMAFMPAIQRDSAWDNNVWSYSFLQGGFTTCYMDLGNCVAWQASHVYTDGQVVVPITPNGKQYFLRGSSYDPTVTNTYTSTATEPSWPTSGNVMASPGYAAFWNVVDVVNGVVLNLPANTQLFVDEIGFICTDRINVTAAPYVSIGTSAAPTSLVNNQQLTQITAANRRHKFTLGSDVPIEGDIKFKVETKATGTNSQFVGRFYVKGMLVQKRG